MFGRTSKTHITTIRCKVLGKDIPVPKNLLAFNSLAKFELSQGFAFTSKEDIRCDGYPEGGLRLQHILSGNKNYVGGTVKINVFSSFLNTGVIMVLGYWQKAAAPENLLKSLLIVCSLQTVTSGMCLLFP